MAQEAKQARPARAIGRAALPPVLAVHNPAQRAFAGIGLDQFCQFESRGVRRLQQRAFVFLQQALGPQEIFVEFAEPTPAVVRLRGIDAQRH